MEILGSNPDHLKHLFYKNFEVLLPIADAGHNLEFRIWVLDAIIWKN
jgi:hypothetical protein